MMTTGKACALDGSDGCTVKKTATALTKSSLVDADV